MTKESLRTVLIAVNIYFIYAEEHKLFFNVFFFNQNGVIGLGSKADTSLFCVVFKNIKLTRKITKTS